MLAAPVRLFFSCRRREAGERGGRLLQLSIMPRQQRKKSGSGRGGSGKPSPPSIASATSNKFAALLLDDDEEATREPDTKAEEALESPDAPPISFSTKEEKEKSSEKGDGDEDAASASSSASSSSVAAAAPTGRPSSPSTPATAPRVALRKPLFWLDLEMTGLDPSADSILEIAVVASDGVDLDIRVPGPSLAISATEEAISRMNAWCVEHHGRSGLTAKCLDPGRSVPLKEAETLVCEFVKRHRPPPREARRREDVGGSGGKNDGDGKSNPPSSSSSSSGPPRMVQDRATLAGNSVHVDFSFLRAHMPELASLCSHRLVDVSSFAEVARRWHPNAFYCAPAKQNAHEAMKDVSDSIDELKYWKEVMFKSAHEVTKAVARTGNAKRG